MAAVVGGDNAFLHPDRMDAAMQTGGLGGADVALATPLGDRAVQAGDAVVHLHPIGMLTLSGGFVCRGAGGRPRDNGQSGRGDEQIAEFHRSFLLRSLGSLSVASERRCR